MLRKKKFFSVNLEMSEIESDHFIKQTREYIQSISPLTDAIIFFIVSRAKKVVVIASDRVKNKKSGKFPNIQFNLKKNLVIKERQ